MATNNKIAAARAFVRSLNILLKFARLYGFDHARTSAQFQTAWSELRAAIPQGTDTGLLLGASSGKLLVDGAPLDATATERSFAQLLSAAGIASLHFGPSASQIDLSCLARAFPTGNAKSSVVAEQLKTALAGCNGIKINEVRFVAEDSSSADLHSSASLAAKAFGADADRFKAWLNDPQKLLELIAAAEGSHTGPGTGESYAGPGPGGGADSGFGPGIGSGAGPGLGAGSGTGSGSGSAPGSARGLGSAAGSGSGGGEGSGQGFSTAGKDTPVGGPGWGDSRSGLTTLMVGPVEEEVLRILRVLASLGSSTGGGGDGAGAGLFQEQIGQLPQHAQMTLREALSSIAQQTAGRRPDKAVLVRLAEHLAIRFALERYERGEVRVNAVREMLDRMNQEIEALRKVLSSHEDKLAQAGVIVESHAEMLDRQFWAAVPESGKRSVLLSEEAWCIPGRNVRYYLDELAKRGDSELSRKILVNYAACIKRDEAEARRRTSIGLGELADLYVGAGEDVLTEAIRQTGVALAAERDAELQTMISAAFVRLSQEAASRRLYAAMRQVMSSLDSIENQRPAFAQALRPRVGIEDRLPEFIDHALRSPSIPAGLPDVLRLMPRPATERLTQRFSRCVLRDDGNRLIELAQQLGEECAAHLRAILRSGQPQEAVDTVALLSRLDLPAVQQFLPSRLDGWPRSAHDRVVRQLAAGGASGRGQLLLELFDSVDPSVMPLILDEIGMSGEDACVDRLARFAAGAVPESAGLYLRIKAIEALGRLRAAQAAPVLHAILEERKFLGWVHPEELRIVAAQALERIDPNWTLSFLPRSGLSPNDLALAPLDTSSRPTHIRQRRYQRVRLAAGLPATCQAENESSRLEILALGLGGGMAQTDRHLQPATPATLKLQAGRRSFKAGVVMRDSRAQLVAFEIIAIDFAERLKLRRLLTSLIASAHSSSANSLDSANSPAPSPVSPS
jgi:hypothetical protein